MVSFWVDDLVRKGWFDADPGDDIDIEKVELVGLVSVANLNRHFGKIVGRVDEEDCCTPSSKLNCMFGQRI